MRNFRQPKILAFCGIDGSGKTTQLNMFSNWLQAQGKSIQVTKAKMINSEVLFQLSENLFNDRYGYHPHIPPLIMNTVLACDVVHHYKHFQTEWDAYDFVLCDRHKLCYLAYSDAYDTPMEWVENIFSLVDDPDLVFYFETPVEMAVARMYSRQDKRIRSDENPQLLSDSSKCYRKRIADLANIVTIDGSLPPQQVHEQVISEFNRLFVVEGR